MPTFNRYTLYLDSGHSTRNFDSIEEIKKYVAELMGVNESKVELEKDVNVNRHSNISVKDKFNNLIRVVGFVYGSVW